MRTLAIIDALLVGLAVAALSMPALADAPIQILDCKGFDPALQSTPLAGAAEHLIEIYADHARVDDIDLYVLTTTPVSYTLDGPVEKLTVGAKLDAKTFQAKKRMRINRVTGQYFVTSRDPKMAGEFSREGDQGCVERKQRF